MHECSALRLHGDRLLTQQSDDFWCKPPAQQVFYTCHGTLPAWQERRSQSSEDPIAAGAGMSCHTSPCILTTRACSGWPSSSRLRAIGCGIIRSKHRKTPSFQLPKAFERPGLRSPGWTRPRRHGAPRSLQDHNKKQKPSLHRNYGPPILLLDP